MEYIHGNECLDNMPALLKTNSEVQMLYASMSGWREDLFKCRIFEILPVNVQNYGASGS